MKIGFLIVDMQHLFLHEQVAQADVEAACEYINHVAGLLRAKNHVVVHVQDMEGSEGDATPEARAIIPEITVEASDLHVAKEYSNAFWQTDLEQVLREQGVEYVVVAGFAVEHCVTFTLNGAQERGFTAALLQKGVLSTKAEAIHALYTDRQLVSYSAIDFMIRALG